MHIKETLYSLLESNSVRTVLAALSIGVAITIYFLNRKRKSLSYLVITKKNLLQVDQAIAGRVQITLDGIHTSDISLVIIEVTNSGNEPIKAKDFEKALSFTFGPRAEVISAKVTRTKPADLAPAVTVGSNNISIDPLLLNKNDSFAVEVVLTKFDDIVKHSARIEGVSEVKLSSTKNQRLNFAETATTASVVVAALAGLMTMAPLAIGSAAIEELLLPIIVSLLGTTAGYYFGGTKKAKEEISSSESDTKNL